MPMINFNAHACTNIPSSQDQSWTSLRVREENYQPTLPESTYDLPVGQCRWTPRTKVEDLRIRPEIVMERQDSSSSSISLNSWGSDLAEDRNDNIKFSRHVVVEPRKREDKGSARPSVRGSVDLHRSRSLPMTRADKEWSSLFLMMKERFAKILLGEDFSGGSRGATPAMTISNAILKLAVSVYGNIWRLEPLDQERKMEWRREMEWLISPCDYIVELVPSAQHLSDGTTVEVMVSKPRTDLYVDLPALQTLDAMLLEILDSFHDTEFWYVDSRQENITTEMGNNFPYCKTWIPVAKVPCCGLSENAKRQLSHQRESANQILKAAKSINEDTLSKMEMPENYWKCLPKSSKRFIADTPLRIVTSEFCCFEALLSTIDRPTHRSLSNLAEGLEALVHIYKLKINNAFRALHSGDSACRATSTWGIGKDTSLRKKIEKKQKYLERAQNLLVELRQRFPGLLHTSLQLRKIQHNKDVGNAVLESYSRALVSVAATILNRIGEVMSAEKDGVLSRIQSSKSNQEMGKATRGSPLASPKAPCIASHRESSTSHLATQLERVLGGFTDYRVAQGIHLEDFAVD